MQFEPNHLYHIFNQGNNKQTIFFEQENYLFFIKKVRAYVYPYCDILAWCLMPNHFHFLVLVREVSHPVTQSHRVTTKLRTLNNSIAIMLRSYTRAIQKQQGTSGSLFREGTKAECLTCPGGIAPSFYNTNAGTRINILAPDKEYPQACFDYIHNNPVKAGLVNIVTDWEYSSARDYYADRKGNLVNREVSRKYISWE